MFLVTDGHHNRVLGVTLDGEVAELIAFDNNVPTGLALWGTTVFMAETGPIPHLPEDGKVVAFGPWLPVVTVASGAPLLVDVEFGRRSWPPWLRHRTLYALSQGFWDPENPDSVAGSPAEPNTGALVKANWDGTFTVIMDGLDRPTSLEFIGNTAYVMTLPGEIWKIDVVSGPPYGPWR